MRKALISLCITACFLARAIAQPVNDYCDGAIVLDEQFIADDCIDLGWRTVYPDLVGAHPTPNLVGCVFDSARSVWYKIPIEEDVLLSIKLSGPVGSQPVLQLYWGSCNIRYIVKACEVAYYGPLYVMDIPVQGGRDYFVVLADATNQSDSLTLSWGKRTEGTVCVENQSLLPVYRSGGQDIAGPYLAGDTIGFLYEVGFRSDPDSLGQNCQWMQGIIPVFGNGWDVGSFTLAGEPRIATLNQREYPAPGVENGSTWQWYTDVRYHHNNCFLNTGDFNDDGRLDLCDGRFDPECVGSGLIGGCCGPCWDSIPGHLLPGGWFASGTDGYCVGDDGHPGVDWGDGNTCNGLGGPWQFYFELIVPEELPDGQTQSDFSIVVHSFADGETGSWVGGPSVCSADYPARFDAPVVLECNKEGNTAYISGKLVANLKGDCANDGNEPGLSRHVIGIYSEDSGSKRYVLTDAYGHYSASLDTGNYVLIPYSNTVQSQECPDSVPVVLSEPCSLLIEDLSIDNDSFCLQNLLLELTATPLRWCGDGVLTLTVSNTGAFMFTDPQVRLRLDTLLTFQSSSVPFDLVSSHEITLYPGSIAAGDQVFVKIRVGVSCSAPVGTIHCAYASLYEELCLAQRANASLCAPSVAAVDPNFKINGKDFSLESTEIEGSEHIEFQIHFQNTGTSYAERITILDTLPPQLDVSTFRFKGSSHEVEVSLVKSHILKFFFNDIHLPDSTSDEPGSHGVVVFEIQPVEGLTVGQSILNDASIYFDYSAPVITNEKEHVVGCGYYISLDSVIISPDHGMEDGLITVFAPAGTSYMYTWNNGMSTNQISGLAAGIYTVTISDETGCLKIYEFEVPFVTSIRAHPEILNISLYPNPAENTLYLLSESASDITTIEILSTDGRVIVSEEGSRSSTHVIDISMLTPALYFCKVSSDTGPRVLKFVKH